MEKKREVIPFFHNGKLIMVPVLEPEELKLLDHRQKEIAKEGKA